MVRGNRTWVSKADLVSRWGHHADRGSGSGVAEERCEVSEKATDNENKGKGVKEVTNLDMDEVFMETEDDDFEQIQAGGNKKRVRSVTI